MTDKNVVDIQTYNVNIDNSSRNEHFQAIRNMMLSSPNHSTSWNQNSSYSDAVNGQMKKMICPIRETMVAYSE